MRSTLPRLPALLAATLLLTPLLLAPLLADCSGEPPWLEARMATARTGPGTVADWMIQGRNDFLVIDLRPAAAFQQGHLPGAIPVEPGRLMQSATVRTLPAYKKVLVYGAEDRQAQLLAPLFARGLHVLTLEGGYDGWVRNVMTRPAAIAGAEDAKREAVRKYFRGESALGTPQPLRNQPAQQYLRPPNLPPAGKPPQLEGC
jgi:hypothetical protein